ncbi:hypothetical protein MUK42_09074 [Musa troglodytarum]|uniref:Uncharacterized protein n=1 Tax=Musa troglodytarum TaxID=320322 RepID=A0A9E7E8P7_9LILI|nr:hypothetical protein MUK42_09074 [Musa troglodytarum]URD72503.1 hypothetical protein MUK42_09074 [Musa troglodytarum]
MRIKLIVDSFPFHSLHDRRHTLGLAWCRSGTDQSGFGRRIPPLPTPYPVRPPPALAGLLPHLHQVNSRILGEKGPFAIGLGSSIDPCSLVVLLSCGFFSACR